MNQNNYKNTYAKKTINWDDVQLSFKKTFGSEIYESWLQKISLIRAIYNNPSILFLDEATTNLDKNSIEIINKLLDEFNGTIINITHNPNQFKKYDNFFIVENKKLINSD